MDGIETKYSRLFRAESGDIIVNKIWARNGSVAVVPDALSGCYGSSEFPMFAPHRDRVEPRWIHWLTKTRSFWELCDEKSRGTSGKNRIRPEQFLEIEIPLPPLAKQQHIVGRIEGLSAKINEARDLRVKSREETEAFTHAMSENAFRELAEQFDVSPIERFCTSITDGDHNTPLFADVGIRFIFVGNVSSGTLHFDSTKYVASEYFQALKPQRVPRRGDILFSAVGATLGVPVIVDSDEPFCFQRHIAILKPDQDRLDSRFAWHMLNSRTVYAQTWKSTTGSAQPTIPLKGIRALPIPAAPIQEQRRIVAELDTQQAEVDALKRHQVETAAELDALLPAILDRAFRGEL